MVKIKKNSTQYQENIKKQQFLNQNGIKVKIDGSWGPWQQKQYKRLTTKQKNYQTTPLGFTSYLFDKITGNTTYQEEPSIVKGYSGEVKQDDRTQFGKKLDQTLQDNKTPLGYAYQTVLPSAIAASTIVNPLITVRTAIPGLAVGLPTSYATNQISKAITGKTTEEIANPYTGNELSFLGNPATYIGGKSAYNFKNLGRFVINDVLPANYKGHGMDFVKAYATALNPFSKVPHFNNGKRPKWHQKGTIYDDQDFRFENAAQWIGIPENEVPRVITFDNGDGTRGFKKALATVDLLPSAKGLKPGNKITHPDLQFGVGGEHSDFTLLKQNEHGNLWLYEDEQILNPQYILADKIKNFFHLTPGNNPRSIQFIDYFGGKDLKGLLGFDNDVKYKQIIYENTKDGSAHLVYPY